MTLSERNLVFKAGIVFTLLFLLSCIGASVLAIPVYDNINITHYSDSFLNTFTGNFFDANLLAVNICILILAIYSFLSTFFIYNFFKKTQSPEILFVCFFVMSFSLEMLRLVILLSNTYEIPSVYLLFSYRIILFGRYFGIFSLFAASVFAAGYQSQGQRNLILFIVVTTLIIVLGVPIETDTAKLNSSLNMIKGYTNIFSLIEAGTFLITTISFFIAAFIRNNRKFLLIGAGSFLVFIGRNILLTVDNWLGPPLGLLCLAAGTWLICTKLHKVYLWY